MMTDDMITSLMATSIGWLMITDDVRMMILQATILVLG